MSSAYGTDAVWNSRPARAAVTVRLLEVPPRTDTTTVPEGNNVYTAQLLTGLVEQLRQAALFDDVQPGNATTEPTTPLLLEVRLIRVYDADWASRALTSYSESSATVVGRLIDRSTDRVLTTFQRSRGGQGGMLGMGGWLTASSDDMARAHINWIATDIINVLRKIPAASRTSNPDIQAHQPAQELEEL
ncbi:MAG: hypothetical protein ACRENP_01310 [Longimicrobiales bacterium]